MVAGSNGIDAWRISVFSSLVSSIKFLWLGLPILLLAAARQSRSGYRSSSLMLGVGVGGVLIDAAGTWECQIVHTQSHRPIREIVCA